MPSEETQQAAILDIRDNIMFAQSLVGGMPLRSVPRQQGDLLRRDALPRNHLRGDAAAWSRDQEPSGAHRLEKNSRAGNIYRQNYEDVQQKLVWSTIHDDLPSLLLAIEAEIARE
jgi:hypothetical protein